jgi:hypothetical protein
LGLPSSARASSLQPGTKERAVERRRLERRSGRGSLLRPVESAQRVDRSGGGCEEVSVRTADEAEEKTHIVLLVDFLDERRVDLSQRNARLELLFLGGGAHVCVVLVECGWRKREANDDKREEKSARGRAKEAGEGRRGAPLRTLVPLLVTRDSWWRRGRGQAGSKQRRRFPDFLPLLRSPQNGVPEAQQIARERLSRPLSPPPSPFPSSTSSFHLPQHTSPSHLVSTLSICPVPLSYPKRE